VLASEDYDYCMEGNFKWLLVAIPVMLVAHAVPGKLHAQAERPSATQKAPARPSNGDNDWTRAPKVLQAANSWRTAEKAKPGVRDAKRKNLRWHQLQAKREEAR
jgi:hypothetical protein